MPFRDADRRREWFREYRRRKNWAKRVSTATRWCPVCDAPCKDDRGLAIHDTLVHVTREGAA